MGNVLPDFFFLSKGAYFRSLGGVLVFEPSGDSGRRLSRTYWGPDQELVSREEYRWFWVSLLTSRRHGAMTASPGQAAGKAGGGCPSKLDSPALCRPAADRGN